MHGHTLQPTANVRALIRIRDLWPLNVDYVRIMLMTFYHMHTALYNVALTPGGLDKVQVHLCRQELNLYIGRSVELAVFVGSVAYC